MTGWWQQLEADAEAVNCADTSEHQAASDVEESRASPRIADMNQPSAPKPELRTSLENEPEQNDRAARLDELLARSDQAAQRIAAQHAERQASSEYAARMELEAQIQAEAGLQAEARDEVELELLRRSASTLPDERTLHVVTLGQQQRLARRLNQAQHEQSRLLRHVMLLDQQHALIHVIRYPTIESGESGRN